MGIGAVKFRGRHNSWRALLGLVLGCITVITFLVMVILSAVNNSARFAYGVIGVFSALINIIGLVLSIKALSERDIYTSVAVAGMVVNGFSFLLYVIIYIMGIV